AGPGAHALPRRSELLDVGATADLRHRLPARDAKKTLKTVYHWPHGHGRESAGTVLRRSAWHVPGGCQALPTSVGRPHFFRAAASRRPPNPHARLVNRRWDSGQSSPFLGGFPVRARLSRCVPWLALDLRRAEAYRRAQSALRWRHEKPPS